MKDHEVKQLSGWVGSYIYGKITNQIEWPYMLTKMDIIIIILIFNTHAAWLPFQYSATQTVVMIAVLALFITGYIIATSTMQNVLWAQMFLS